ncbi:MAG: hypothetical protein R2688_00530 [Fimbriimonadaceae bacterium]
MKMNPSLKAVLIGGAFLGALYGAYWGYGELQLKDFEVTPVAPGQVNMIAFDATGKYRIRVANRVATLVELSGDATERRASSMSAGDGDSRRIPIREMLGALQGNEEDLGYLITSMNNLKEDDLPGKQVIWPASELKSALDGDTALMEKLENDLLMQLDGTPLDRISMTALMNGIVIELPVPMEINVGGEIKTVTGTVKVPFRTRLMAAFQKAANERANISEDFVVGTYGDLAKGILDADNGKEDLRGSLTKIISKNQIEQYRKAPARLLQSAEVLINDEHLRGCETSSYKDDRGNTITDMSIRVNDEGRKRLWKHSRDTKGFSLMLIVDGVALAAPEVVSQLGGSEVKISRLMEQRLAEEAKEKINAISEQQGKN